MDLNELRRLIDKEIFEFKIRRTVDQSGYKSEVALDSYLNDQKRIITLVTAMTNRVSEDLKRGSLTMNDVQRLRDDIMDNMIRAMKYQKQRVNLLTTDSTDTRKALDEPSLGIPEDDT